MSEKVRRYTPGKTNRQDIPLYNTKTLLQMSPDYIEGESHDPIKYRLPTKAHTHSKKKEKKEKVHAGSSWLQSSQSQQSLWACCAWPA